MDCKAQINSFLWSFLLENQKLEHTQSINCVLCKFTYCSTHTAKKVNSKFNINTIKYLEQKTVWKETGATRNVCGRRESIHSQREDFFGEFWLVIGSLVHKRAHFWVERREIFTCKCFGACMNNKININSKMINRVEKIKEKNNNEKQSEKIRKETS